MSDFKLGYEARGEELKIAFKRIKELEAEILQQKADWMIAKRRIKELEDQLKATEANEQVLVDANKPLLIYIRELKDRIEQARDARIELAQKHATKEVSAFDDDNDWEPPEESGRDRGEPDVTDGIKQHATKEDNDNG